MLGTLDCIGWTVGLLGKALADDESGQININLRQRSNIDDLPKHITKMSLSKDEMNRALSEYLIK